MVKFAESLFISGGGRRYMYDFILQSKGNIGSSISDRKVDNKISAADMLLVRYSICQKKTKIQSLFAT